MCVLFLCVYSTPDEPMLRYLFVCTVQSTVAHEPRLLDRFRLLSDLPLPLAQAPTSNVLHISYSITRGAGIDKECIQYEIRHTSRCGRPLVSMVMRISGLHGSGVQIVRRASDRATVYAMDTVPLLGKTRRSRRGREVLHVARLEELAWLCVVVEELTWLRAL